MPPDERLGPNELERLAIIKAGENFDDWQDCTCGDPDEEGTCWYHLTDEEQMNQRVDSVVRQIDDQLDAAVVRRVLEEDRA